jgi:hypothetical protein
VPGYLWVIFWLFCVNWKKAWPVLAHGAWAPVLLLMLIAAEVWSRINPIPCDCLRFVIIPNFWWQLGSVATLVAIALLCGWLQHFLGWTPPEIPVEPAPAAHGHHEEHH